MTQNDNPEFFRTSLSYYLAKIAATMRVRVVTKDRGEIPVNQYVVNLATSGHGKGFATGIIEEQLINVFQTAFETETLPIITEERLAKIALHRANIQNEDETEMFDKVKEECKSLGELLFSFDSASGAPAIKQLQQKLLMLGIGSMNMEIDEIGSNLSANMDAFAAYLELYDVGNIKQKLIKNSKENTRSKEIKGRTPANLLVYGTPSKLFDGSKTEEDFYSLLVTGFARRCLFGLSNERQKDSLLTPEEVYDILTDTNTSKCLKDTALHLGSLASPVNHNKKITVSKKVSILIIEYRMLCEELANKFGEHQDVARAELAHRYFKALKLAGSYAFVDGNDEITEENYYHAICMVEESGKAFDKILSRDHTYVKLAKYLGTVGHEVTHVDLAEDLPFYRGSMSAKQDLLLYATAWGHKNHIVIKRSHVSGIEFLTGETLQKTDLKHLLLSYSDDIADGYTNVQAPWEQLYKLTQQPMKHWINHHSSNGHRSEDDMVPGFDMVVLDVDEGTTIQEVQLLLKEYKYLLYTTKRHTNQEHRFRVILPLNYHLKLDMHEYRQFMRNIYEWLPFDVDTGGVDRCRKWLSHKGGYQYSTGEELMDARLFIPKTTKNDERKEFVATYQSMTNMERWFITSTKNGNRNHQLTRYAFMLMDLGYPIEDIRDNVFAMNSKLPDKLTKKEIESTMIYSVTRKIADKNKTI
jgi:hypothetical protein